MISEGCCLIIAGYQIREHLATSPTELLNRLLRAEISMGAFNRMVDLLSDEDLIRLAGLVRQHAKRAERTVA